MSLKSILATTALSTMATFSAFGQNKDGIVSPELQPAKGYHLSVETGANNAMHATYQKGQDILKLDGIDRDGNGILSPNEITSVTNIARLADDMNHISVAQRMPSSDEFLNITTTQLKRDGQTHSSKTNTLYDNFTDMVKQNPVLKQVLPQAGGVKPNTPKR